MTCHLPADGELLLHAIAERLDRDPDDLRAVGVDALIATFSASLLARSVPSGVFREALPDWEGDAETPIFDCEPLARRR
jgi:hypothetical protein